MHVIHPFRICHHYYQMLFYLHTAFIPPSSLWCAKPTTIFRILGPGFFPLFFWSTLYSTSFPFPVIIRLIHSLSLSPIFALSHNHFLWTASHLLKIPKTIARTYAIGFICFSFVFFFLCYVGIMVANAFSAFVNKYVGKCGKHWTRGNFAA